ncbi:hypothetical protein HYH02_010216 [Chlamydomonas schloesseri]|uniref:Uncharacterized protein n=1 Tax=Chlamydomonas schloesseri TaxID=2026947 RepID=A0A835W4U5_9CHLO|nr:hypothetical protein HYH02_010216 [Chlamydomonas schloesseri]|eukprot:KAG2440637.1 hypothetical protein HYH02_010216 [Chlamydomonas schloesseri]
MSHESGASEAQATVNLVELFQEGDNCIERRRTDNLFRQLDERQLTEDEQSIIQQRVELQRKMFQEYERREKQRKVRELQEVCPDLDEEAATRALELCLWKEEDAAVRISSDPAFLRRVCSGVVDAAPAPEPVRRPRATTTRAPVGPRPKKVDPNKVGAVFVGRFKSRLGPHQLSAMERQQRTVAPASAAAGSSGQGRRGGRAAKADTDAAKAAAVVEEEQEAHAAEEPEQQQQQQAAEGADADMADVEAQHAPEGAEGEYETEEGDDAEAEPNSADLSDNEPQYEDDVMLPVMSPLPAARQQQPDHQDQGQEQGQDEQQQPDQGDQAGAAAERAPGQSPRFQYRLVAETPNGGVHSVATTEWNTVRDGGAGKAGGAEGVQAASNAGAAPTPVGGCAAPKAATGLAMAGAGAAEGEEVNSPRQHLQLSGPFTATRSGTKQAASLQQTGAAAAAAAAAKALAACATSAPAAAKAEAVAAAEATAQQEAKQEPLQAAAAPDAVAAAPAGRGGRARRAAAATALLRASARRAARSGSADSDAEVDPIESGSESGAETATDGSDFEAELETAVRGTGAGARAGRAGVAAAVLAAAAAASSSDSDDDFVDDEASDEDFMESGGGRKRRGGGGRQPARKRGRAAVAAVVTAPVAAQAAAAAPMHKTAPVPAAVPAPAVEAGTSGRDAAAAEAHDSEATETEDEGPAGGRVRGGAKGKKAGGRGGRGGGTKAGAVGAAGGGAISASGHTCRGRVKQKGVKRAELLSVGTLVPRQGWFNAGYIFPAGFKASTSFRSSVDLDALTVHTCEVIGEGGQYWPQPTYVVTAADRPDEPLVAKSCTGCWTAVLKRINAEIEGRRAAGEPLPPPPKTAIAGPEYFGLNQPDICAAIESLDPEHQCAVYWDGKMDREAARGGQPAPARARPAAAAAGGEGGAAPAKAPRAPRTSTGGGAGRGRRGGRRGSGAVEEEDEPEGANGDEDPEETYAGNRWSAVSRAERYRKRREEAGEDAAALLAEANATNPLPGFLDPITLEPVVNPAISPYGHVMGLATWKAVLAEQGRCPFTKKSLKAEALTVLTLNNIERYRSRIVNSI